MDTLGTHPFVLCREVVLFWRLYLYRVYYTMVLLDCPKVVERFILFWGGYLYRAYNTNMSLMRGLSGQNFVGEKNFLLYGANKASDSY